MSDLSAYSDCLPFLEAKKLLALMQKPGKGGHWTDWSGEGGSQTEEKMRNIAISDLLKWKVPDFCSSYRMDLPVKIFATSYLPDEPWIGGDSFNLPEYGDDVIVSVRVVLQDLNYPVNFYVTKNSGMRHYGRKYNQCCSIGLSFPKMAYQTEGLSYGELPDKATAREAVEILKNKFCLPDRSSPDLLEERELADAEMGEFSINFETSLFGNLKKCFNDMLEHILVTSPCKFYQLQSSVCFGGAAKFEGELHNVTPVIRELLPLVDKVNDFPAYDITYYPLGPRNWKDREKSRKKWKKPIREQLGTLTLENGAVAEVRLVIEKEGYVFSLNFGNDEDVIKFFHSKLFQKTKWHSGAE